MCYREIGTGFFSKDEVNNEKFASVQSVQFVFFPLSFRQVVGSVSILDGGNSGKIKHDKEAYGSSGLESVFYSLV